MSLSGPFVQVKEQTFATAKEALIAVTAYAEAEGFTHVQEKHDDDDGYRITARTPGGRGGRNVAFVDYDPGEEACLS